MKLRYFIPSLLAVVASVFTGCSEDYDPTYLDQIQVSQSYVALNTNGGSTNITLTAKGAWQFEKVIKMTTKDAEGKDVVSYVETPAWLQVSQLSGNAGETTLTFSAEAGEGRNCELKVSCNGQTQIINIIQGVATVSTATCAEVIAGPESKTYRVTGVVTKIANTTYGNWYLKDATGEVYIYGTLDKKGAEKNFLSLGIEVGDEVTVEGPKQLYNGTVELVNVTVVNINKSLIKVDSLSVAGEKVAAVALPLEGGEVTAHVTCKGDGINAEIPQDAKDWLFISAVTSNTITFRALPNTAGDRSTTVTLKTYKDGREYTSQFAVAQAGAIIDATVAEFLAAEVGDTQYRLEGVITAIYDRDNQGKSFYIKDYTGETLVYRAEGFLDSGIKVGDVVTVLGKRGAYKDSPQMVNGSCVLKHAVKAVSIAEFLTMPDDKNVYYMVTGKISSLLGSNGKENDYGNLYIKDGDNELYVYGTYAGWNAQGDARKFFIADNGLKVGDEITIIGYKDTYKELVELCQGVCFSFKKAGE